MSPSRPSSVLHASALTFCLFLVACESGPESAWHGVQDAWEARSVQQLREHVEIEPLVTHTVDQFFQHVMADVRAGAANEREQIGAVRDGAFLESTIKPDIIADAVSSLEQSFREGQLVVEIDISKYPGTVDSPMVRRTPLDSLPLRIRSFEVADRAETRAELLLELENTESGERTPLRLQTERREDRWVIVEVNGLI